MAVIIVIAAVAFVVSSDDDHDDKDLSGRAADDIRLKIHGNANGDDVLDELDKDVIQHIIDCNTDDDESNDIDWRAEYPFADANQDGVIDSKDVQRVDDFLNKREAKMWYSNMWGRDTYINYPMGQNIALTSTAAYLLMATHTYDMWKGTDAYTIGLEDDYNYPGWENLKNMGDLDSYEAGQIVEELTKGYQDYGINTYVEWTGGQMKDVMWDIAVDADIADKISIVLIPIQGPECVNSALMFACMLGDQSLSKDYVDWYDRAMAMFDAIPEKKTILVHCALNDLCGPEDIYAYGQAQRPALWFNTIVNFQPAYYGKTVATYLGYEGFVETASDEITVVINRARGGTTVAPEDFNDYVEKILNQVFPNTKQLEEQKIYVMEWSGMPFFIGPAGCYIYAAHLYPDQFDLEQALDFLQEYLDKFTPNPTDNARVGFTYTGSGYYKG